METEFQTSFIPKKPLAEDRAVSTRPVSLLIFIATIIFFASIAAAGLMYFYKVSLERSVASKKADLLTAKEAFEGDFIAQLQNFDRRLVAANQILSNHVLVSPILQALSAATLKSIQYTKFTHTIKGSGSAAQIEVRVSGRAESYSDVGYTHLALESDTLTENKYIKDPIFSNVTLDKLTGNVLFELSFNVDPSFVLYTDVLKRAEAAGTTDTDTTVPESAPPEDGSVPPTNTGDQ